MTCTDIIRNKNKMYTDMTSRFVYYFKQVGGCGESSDVQQRPAPGEAARPETMKS